LLDKICAADDRWRKDFLKEITMANGRKYYRRGEKIFGRNVDPKLQTVDGTWN
jgi:hypothetical protein